MYCERCGKKEKIQEHHVLFKCMRKDNKTVEDGKRVWLCEDCHKLIANYLMPVIWSFVSDKDECKKAVKKFTEEWIKNGRYS